MEDETRHALLFVCKTLKAIVEQSSTAHAMAMSLESAIQNDAKMAEAFEESYRTFPVTDVKLEAAHLQLSLDDIIAKLEK